MPPKDKTSYSTQLDNAVARGDRKPLADQIASPSKPIVEIIPVKNGYTIHVNEGLPGAISEVYVAHNAYGVYQLIKEIYGEEA